MEPIPIVFKAVKEMLGSIGNSGLEFIGQGLIHQHATYRYLWFLIPRRISL